MAKSKVGSKPTTKRRAFKADPEFETDGAEAEVSDEPPMKEAVQKKPEVKAFERSFTKTKKIVSDVFKLKSAEVIKQVGIAKHPDENPDDFRPFDHTHIFRTFDSDGKRHERCCSTAGHFHDIEWEYDKNNIPVIKSVSGPMVMGKSRVKGRHVQVSKPANSYDDHTHDFDYLQSHEVQARRSNIEAAKVVAFEAQKGAAPKGAIEGT